MIRGWFLLLVVVARVVNCMAVEQVVEFLRERIVFIHEHELVARRTRLKLLAFLFGLFLLLPL